MTSRTLKEIGIFPIPGDAIEVRDRWEPHAMIATVTVASTDATHVEVESRLEIAGDAPFRYRISRLAWAQKCAAPNQVLGGSTP